MSELGHTLHKLLLSLYLPSTHFLILNNLPHLTQVNAPTNADPLGHVAGKQTGPPQYSPPLVEVELEVEQELEE